MSTDDREANQPRTEIIVIEIRPLCVFITIGLYVSQVKNILNGRKLPISLISFKMPQMSRHSQRLDRNWVSKRCCQDAARVSQWAEYVTEQEEDGLFKVLTFFCRDRCSINIISPGRNAKALDMSVHSPHEDLIKWSVVCFSSSLCFCMCRHERPKLETHVLCK